MFTPPLPRGSADASWPDPTGSLVALRRCFTAPSFRTFCGLAAGLAGQPRRRAVVGMLLGAGLSRAWPHDRAHYFFARARWEMDELGLAVARLAVLLVPVGAPLTVAADDSLFRRAGRKVYGAGWQYDGSRRRRPDERDYLLRATPISILRHDDVLLAGEDRLGLRCTRAGASRSGSASPRPEAGRR